MSDPECSFPRPPLSSVQSSARSIVRAAKTTGTLSELTPRIIRGKIEEELELESGTLDDNEYKSAVKVAVDEAVNEDTESESEIVKPPTKKRKSQDGHVSDAGETQKKAAKKAKTSPPKAEKPASATKPRPASKARPKPEKGRNSYKSAAEVPTSDEDEDEPEAGPSKAASAPPTKGSTSKAQAKPSKTKSASAKPPSPAKKTEPIKKIEKHTGSASESEMSSLIDEPPARKRSKNRSKDKDKDARTKTKAKSKTKQPSTTLTKDEEAVKKLKSFVLACGVRKVWAKELAPYETPKAQAAHLRSMLADLGMEGRMSLEQAKRIKAKRELAQELEDVQQFEAAHAKRTSRSAAKAIEAKTDSGHEGIEDGDGSDEDAPRGAKRGSARQSIMAFLDDQSESD